MEHVVHATDRAMRDVDVGEVAVNELDLRQVREVLALAGDQAVDHANGFATTDEGFGEMGPDEPGAPGDEIVSHIANVGPEPGPLYRFAPAEGKGIKQMSQPAGKPNPVRLAA